MLVEFSKLRPQAFFIFIFPIFNQLRKIIIIEICGIKDNYFFDLFRLYLSYLLSIIFIIIIKYRTKGIVKNNDEISNKDDDQNKGSFFWLNPLNMQRQLRIKEKRLKNILFLLLLVTIFFASNIFNIIYRTIFYEKKYIIGINLGKQSIGINFEIIFFLVLSKYILDLKIYRHQIISLIMIVLNLLILFGSFVFYFQFVTFNIITYYFFYSFLFCLYLILIKKYLNLFYISPYIVMFNIGLFSCIIIIIYDIIVYSYIGNDNNNIHGIILGFKNNLNISFIFLFILDIIFYFLSNIGMWLTVHYLTPFHFPISESISEYIYYAYDYFFKGEKYKVADVILYSLVYIFNTIFVLIFNEIIILNFCGLEYNIKKNIEIREKFDLMLASKNPESSTVQLNKLYSLRSITEESEQPKETEKEKEIELTLSSE